MRFALGGISTESNGFVSHAADEPFLLATGFIKAGAEMLELEGRSSEIGGALAYLRRNSPESALIPTVGARANSGGPLDEALWATLRDGLVSRVAAAAAEAPLDGVLLAMHGAMSVGPGGSAEPDPEGALAAAARGAMGAAGGVLVMTLDLHANVTALMVSSCDAIVSYDHYPHDDIVRTGERGAALMLKAAKGEVRLGMAAAKLRMLQTAFHCKTNLLSGAGGGGAEGLGAILLRKSKAAEQTAAGRRAEKLDGSGEKLVQTVYDDAMLDPHDGGKKVGCCHYGETLSNDGAPCGVLNSNVNFCYPYTDFADMGNTAVVVVDLELTTLQEAEAIAQEVRTDPGYSSTQLLVEFLK